MTDDNRAPVADEVTLDDVPVEGRLPAGLEGTLYRNGPNPREADGAMHWFFGQGMLHAFQVKDGRVAYRNRWVQTGAAEGVANTSVVASGGALLALEEAHRPVAFDGESLAGLGVLDFGGALPPGPFTAHPKRCPVTGNLVFFGYMADGYVSDTIRLGEIAPDNTLLWVDKVTAPYGAMIHDFVVTARFIAIPLFPLVLDLAQGGFVWKPELGCFLGVMERAAGVGSLRWLPMEQGFAFHVANAWDEDGHLAIELMLSDAPPLFPQPEGEPADTRAYLTRLDVVPGSAAPAVARHRLTQTQGEFPRIDERWEGRRHGRVFWSTGEAVVARAAACGTEQAFGVDPGDGVSEPVFVPRGATEGDGWLLAVVYRAATRTSDMVVLDAQSPEAGPLARVRLPVRVPDGFHGAWVGSAA